MDSRDDSHSLPEKFAALWDSAESPPDVFAFLAERPNVTPDNKRYMGYSMVTERYHYVEWRTWDNDAKRPGELVAQELYDNQADPDENLNIAGFTQNQQLLAQLAEQLRAGWVGALPRGVRAHSSAAAHLPAEVFSSTPTLSSMRRYAC